MKCSVVVTSLSLAALLVATGARADAKEDAESRFRAGVALQKVEDWDAAVVEFEASLRLYPTKSALFNLANALRATHRYVDALDALERLQREYGHELDEEMRRASASLSVELESLTATLRIEVNHPGATISVDGSVVGTSPLDGPVRLSVGDHRIEVSLEGYSPTSSVVNLASRDEETTTVSLYARQPEPPPPAAVEPVTPPPPIAPPRDPVTERHGPNLKVGGWVTASTGVALLGAGAVTGAWALTLDGQLQSDCIDIHCPPSRESDVDRLETLAPTTSVLLAIGSVATLAGVTLLIVDKRSRRNHSTLKLDVQTGRGFVGAAATGHF